MDICKSYIIFSFFLQTPLITSAQHNFSVDINPATLLGVNKLFQYIGDNTTNFLESASSPGFPQQSFQQLMDKIKPQLDHQIGNKTKVNSINIFIVNLEGIAAHIEQYIDKWADEIIHIMKDFISNHCQLPCRPVEQITTTTQATDEATETTTSISTTTPKTTSSTAPTIDETSETTTPETTSSTTPAYNIVPEFKIHIVARITEAYGIRLILHALRINDILVVKLSIARFLWWRKRILSKCVPVDTKLIYKIYNDPAAIARYIGGLNYSNSSFKQVTEEILADMDNANEIAEYYERKAASIKEASTPLNDNKQQIANIFFIATAYRTHYVYLHRQILVIVEYLSTIHLICEGLVDLLDQQRKIKENVNILNNIIIAAGVSQKNYEHGWEQIEHMVDHIRWNKGTVDRDDEAEFYPYYIVRKKKKLAQVYRRQLKLAKKERNVMIASARATLDRVAGLFKRLSKIKFKMYVQRIVLKIKDLVKRGAFVSRCANMDVVIQGMEQKIENIISGVCQRCICY